MDARLVRERAESRDRVVERDRDLDGVGDQVLDLAEHGQVVLALGVDRVDDHLQEEEEEREESATASRKARVAHERDADTCSRAQSSKGIQKED